MKIYEISKGATFKYPPGERIRAEKYQQFPKGYTIFLAVGMHVGSDLRQPHCATGITVNLKKPLM